MSHVADVILLTGPFESGGASQMNTALAKQYPRFPVALSAVHDDAGGGRAMQCDVYIGAYNYLDIPTLVAAFQVIKWRWPESAHLLISDEHDDQFTSYRIEENDESKT